MHGEVIASNSIMQDDVIYTENVLQIDKILTGDSKVEEVTILTRGGTIDGVTQFQSHGFSLRKGDIGFFFLKEKQTSWRENYYEVYAGRQGFYQKRHDGFMTKLYSQMKSYPSLNSFYKNFGLEYDELKFEEEMRALNNPDACLRYRLEPIETTDIGASNQISFNIFVRSTEPVSLLELSIQLNYSTNWFGQNVVANNKLNLNDGDFNESYTLQSTDVSEDILEVSLRSNSPIGQLQLVSGTEIRLATVSISFEESASELPILVENTIYRSLYYDEDGNLVRNNCGHIEISDRGCAPIIDLIDERVAAGNQRILIIRGSGFINSNVTPADIYCGLPNTEHRVKFRTINLDSEFIAPLEGDYISWTDNEIQVKVPTVGYVNDCSNRTDERKDEIACTGEIIVCIDDTPMSKCACFDMSDISDNDRDGILYVPFSTYTRDNTNNNDYQAGDCLESDHARLSSSVQLQTILYNLDNLPNQESKDAFERALDTWRCAVDINLQIVTNPNPQTEVVQVEIGAVNTPGGKVADTNLSTITCDIDNQRILIPTAITFINPPNDWDWYYDVTLPVPPNMRDFESAALHEIGHSIGLNHTCNFDNVMWPSWINLETERRVLHEDDIEGGVYCQGRSKAFLPPQTNGIFCGIALIDYPFTCTTSTANLYSLAPFEIYPNPANHYLNIDTEEGLRGQI